MHDWQAIVHQHGPVVWRAAYRLLANRTDAADCFQETFLDALRVAGRETIENWPGLLQHLATTRALDCLRRRIRERNRYVPPADWEAVLSLAPGPLEQAQASELAQRLRQALAQLPLRQADVFCLRYLSELSYDEIADQLDMPINTVGVLLHRARARLRQILIDAPEVRPRRR